LASFSVSFICGECGYFYFLLFALLLTCLLSFYFAPSYFINLSCICHFVMPKVGVGK